MTLLAWRMGFLRSRGLSNPDARPLCSYKCSTEEFSELEKELRGCFRDEAALRKVSSLEAAGFVLYGAEWFRRKHTGGPWSWDGIFMELGLSHPLPQQLYRAVELGLRNWQRKLVYVGNNRAFLMTLAAEGGLPLRLLHDPHAHLRRYFRALFEQFELFGRSGVEPSLLAARVKHYLPRSFQQDVVYRIAGELAGDIWRFSNELGDCERPLEMLEKQHPDWKNSLPIAIQDDTAEALLRGLVTDATSFASGRSRVRTLRAETFLRRKSDGWVLERDLRLPGKLGEDALGEVLDIKPDQLPPRFELALDDGHERKTVALVSRKTGDESTEFVVEPLHRGTTRYEGESALHPLQIVAECGHRIVGQTELAGASELGELPWVFVPIAGSDDRFRLVSRGSARVRHDTAIAAVTAETEVLPEGEGIAEPVGVIEAVGRRLYRAQGIVRFSSEDSRCSVRTAAPADDTVDYLIRGTVFPYSRGQLPVHIGVPRIYAQDSTGALKRVREDQLQWRPRQLRNAWRTLGQDCAGDVIIRHVSDGETRFQEDFRILPNGSVFDMVEAEQTDSGSTHFGAWRIRGSRASLVGGVSTSSMTLLPEQDGDDWRVTANAKAPVPSTVQVTLNWGDTQRVSVDLPFPSRIVRFLRGSADELRSGASVQWQQLGRVRAQAIGPSQNMRFVVAGNLSAGDLSEELRRNLTIEAELRQIDPFTHELDLGDLRKQIELMFASTKDLDAILRLRIICKHGFGKFAQQELLVTRFEGFVAQEDEASVRRYLDDIGIAVAQHRFVLQNAQHAPLSLDNESEARVEALALWDPSKRTELLRTEDSFSFADTVEPGTWVVMGWEGAASHFRPLVLPIDGWQQNDPGTLSLFSVCNIANPTLRHTKLDELVSVLANDVGHADWNHVIGFFGAMSDVPPTTFDLLDRLVDDPDAVALAALKVSSESFGELWDGFEHLPFSWAVLPVSSWIRAARIHVDDIRKQLEGVDLPGETREQIASQSLRNILETAPRLFPPMHNVADLVQRNVLGKAPPNSMLQVAGSSAGAAFFHAELEKERVLLRQVHAEEHWPEWPDLQEAAGPVLDAVPDEVAKPLLGQVKGHWRAPLMYAPILAALASASGTRLSRAAVYNLRRLEEFDRFWFRTAYGYAHTCAVAALHPPEGQPQSGSSPQGDSTTSSAAASRGSGAVVRRRGGKR